MARGAPGPVLPAEHLVLAGEWCSAVPGQDLAELDEFAVGRRVYPVGQDEVRAIPGVDDCFRAFGAVAIKLDRKSVV